MESVNKLFSSSLVYNIKPLGHDNNVKPYWSFEKCERENLQLHIETHISTLC
jgi:hypothetical protein